MAQIIKHRRGSIDSVKATTTRNGELLIASGSISDLAGPFVFIGSPASTDEGVAGAFKPTSKIYSGTNAPDIAASTYGSILDGTPFYASSNESLYILNNDGVGNSRMDLTGNIEGNTIANVTITSLTGSNANVTNVTGGTVTVTSNQTIGGTLGVTGNTAVGGNMNVTGDITGSNLRLSGDAEIAGNINLGGNITVGDATTDFVKFGADVSSSIIPDVNNAFDLGSTQQAWRNLHVSGTAYIQGLAIEGDIELTNLSLPGNLVVSGTTTLGDASDDTITINGSTINVPNIATGTDNSVVVYNGSSLVTDEIDGRVWGDTLMDNNGTPLTANRVPFALDGDSLQDDAEFTYDEGQNILTVASSRVGDDISVGNKLTTNGISELKGAVGINSTLSVTGSATLKDNLSVNGNTLITGTTSISGSTTIDDTLRVTGVANLESNTNVHGELTVTGNTNLQANLYVSGNLEVLGSATNVTIQSTTVEIDDNIIKLNAYSPFERYAGFEVMDSGSSGVSASLVWDSQLDYWMFVSSSGQSSKLIGTSAGTYGSEVSLTANYIPRATGASNIGDSLLQEDGSRLVYNTNAFIVDTDGHTQIRGNVTLDGAGGTDAGSKTSTVMFRDSSNMVGYVSTTDSTEVLDGILGYKSSDGALTFSRVIDGGTY